VARAITIVLALPGFGGLGCAHVPIPGMRGSQPAISEEELREELAAFSSRFTSVVSNAADRIRQEAADPRTRRSALLWEIRLVPLIQQAAFVPDPQEAFVAVAGITVMQRRFLTEGDGAKVFGPEQPIAVEAARQLSEDFWQIGALFLNEAELAKFRAEVEDYAGGPSISGSDFTVANVRRRVRQVRQDGRFDWVVDLPMSPFRALEGVGSGAEAIHDFNETAMRFAQTVEALPEQLRWQSQLLLYDVESRESLITALDALESVAESARLLSTAAERLPAEVEALLGSSQGAIAEANRTLRTAQGLIEPLLATAEQLNLAGASWGALFARDGEPDPDARPFDIREYEAAAVGIGGAAFELRALAAELEALAGSPALETTLGGFGSTVSSAEASGRSVVDHAAWRGFQLLLAFFALLLAYRVVAARLAPRSP